MDSSETIRLMSLDSVTQSHDRNKVISASVIIETTLSHIIAYYLDIKTEGSKSFGRTSSALSFNAKINLFHDMDMITKFEKKYLLVFAEIRNVFAHRMEIDSMFSLLEAYPDKKKFLERHFSNSVPGYQFSKKNSSLLLDLLLRNVGLFMFNIDTKSREKKGELSHKLFVGDLTSILWRKVMLIVKKESDTPKEIKDFLEILIDKSMNEYKVMPNESQT